MSDQRRSTQEHLDELWVGHLFGDLTPEQEGELARLLAADPEMAVELAAQEQLLETLPTLPPMDPPQHVVDEVLRESRRHLETLKQRHESGFWTRFWVGLRPAIAMGAAAAVTLVVGYYAVEHAIQPDEPGSRQRMQQEMRPSPQAEISPMGEKGQPGAMPAPEAVKAQEEDDRRNVAGKQDEGLGTGASEGAAAATSTKQAIGTQPQPPAAATAENLEEAPAVPAAAPIVGSRQVEADPVRGGGSSANGYKAVDSVINLESAPWQRKGKADADVQGLIKDEAKAESAPGTANKGVSIGTAGGLGGGGSVADQTVRDGQMNRKARAEAGNAAGDTDTGSALTSTGLANVPRQPSPAGPSQAPSPESVQTTNLAGTSDDSAVPAGNEFPMGQRLNTPEPNVSQESWVRRRDTGDSVVQQAFEALSPAEDQAEKNTQTTTPTASVPAQVQVASTEAEKPAPQKKADAEKKTAEVQQKSEQAKPQANAYANGAAPKDTAAVAADCGNAYSGVVALVNQGRFAEADVALKSLEASPCAGEISSGKRQLVRAKIELGQGQREKARAKLKSLSDDPDAGQEAEELLDSVEP